jgi:ATP-dependent helicase YprA (DUF1998 family)
MVLVADPGMGKTVCLFAWAFKHLLEGGDESTAMLLVPTQAILWAHADSLKKMTKDQGLQDTLVYCLRVACENAL